MRKLIGTCLLCCLWSAPARACFDEYVPVKNDPSPQEATGAPLPSLAANSGRAPAISGVRHATRSDWLAVQLGTMGVATLCVGIVFATWRNCRRQVSSVTETTTTQPTPESQA